MTTFSTPYEPGAVVVALIRFTNQAAAKRRPAVIVAAKPFHVSRADTIIMPLTSNLSTTHFGDYDLVDWAVAGLNVACRLKGVIQTIERSAVDKRIGHLTARDLSGLQGSLQLMLDL